MNSKTIYFLLFLDIIRTYDYYSIKKGYSVTLY